MDLVLRRIMVSLVTPTAVDVGELDFDIIGIVKWCC